jgi:NADH-quinone oxidoreductase subunit J
MLVEMSKKRDQQLFQLQSRYAVVAVLVGAAGFLAVFRKVFFGPPSAWPLVLRPELAQGLNVAKQNAQAVSRGLFADYLLPFEILSVVLLVALVGAVVLAKTERV